MEYHACDASSNAVLAAVVRSCSTPVPVPLCQPSLLGSALEIPRVWSPGRGRRIFSRSRTRVDGKFGLLERCLAFGPILCRFLPEVA